MDQQRKIVFEKRHGRTCDYNTLKEDHDLIACICKHPNLAEEDCSINVWWNGIVNINHCPLKKWET